MRIHEAGHGPAVLLLHGTPSPASDYAPLADVLSRTHRVLLPTLPGYSGEEAVTGAGAFHRVGAMLEDALISRGIEEAAVVGFSGGAYRAAALAFSGRLRVTHLVLLAGFVGLPAEVKEGFRGFATALRAGVDLRPVFPTRMLSAPYLAAHPEAAARVTAWADLSAPEDLADELVSFTEVEDFRPRFGTLDIPITARVGTFDQAAPPAFSEELARLNSRVNLEIVENCGHALFIEDLAGTNDSIRRALAG